MAGPLKKTFFAASLTSLSFITELLFRLSLPCHFQYFCLNKRIYEGSIDRSIINNGRGFSSVRTWDSPYSNYLSERVKPRTVQTTFSYLISELTPLLELLIEIEGQRCIRICINHLASLMSTNVSYFKFEFKGTKSERGSVAKCLNNTSGQPFCLSTLLFLYKWH